ncbi:signal peptide, CUB and EGF-like domain-containing protein 1 [Branchiostoma floridae]|uniref:Signal peptide, CUB and EGF-like domain-containing protein 1 n=2 Tax=Branchiostoma floridae TaxID=7739 RepID=A0A9J7L665_BRAFL|nr:signal peptide, CUB and EGF-like domain-containing protein 1 [Branchiostoma floridae]
MSSGQDKDAFDSLTDNEKGDDVGKDDSSMESHDEETETDESVMDSQDSAKETDTEQSGSESDAGSDASSGTASTDESQEYGYDSGDEEEWTLYRDWTIPLPHQPGDIPQRVIKETKRAGKKFYLIEFAALPHHNHNDCDQNPCGVHAIACQDNVGFYSCVCEMGFTGTHCDVNINDCHNSSCRNGGTCVDGVGNYTCVCPDGFNGKLCEKQIVYGGWSQWTDWTPCSVTCGNGTHERWRQCNSPPPKEDGKDCVGISTEMETCRLQDCPSCLELKPPFGIIMECYRNETEGEEYCQIDCGPGLEFSETPLPLYTCGPKSQYRWNHQTENNPKATLPACSHGRIPKTFFLEYEIKYPDLFCTSADESLLIAETIRDVGSKNVEDVDCVWRKTCNATVEVHNCGTYEKNTSPVSIGLVLCGQVSGTFNVDENGNITSEGHEAFSSLSETIMDLASAAEEIQNKSSSSDFAVVIDGQSFEVEANGSKPRFSADCPPGMTAQKMVCVYCAPGTYYLNRMCIRCPKGTFQDLEGQMFCISCPEGFTTAGVGSNNYTDCFPSTDEPMTQTEQGFTMTSDDTDYTSTILPTTTPLGPDDTEDTTEIKGH